jgi:hypothetical protein
MIHYFNPGHETAILHNSKYYQAAANQIKMQQDLAFLSAWYAQATDFVLVENPLNEDFISTLQALKPLPLAICVSDLAQHKNRLSNQTIDLWGISPADIYYFEKLKKQSDLDWQIPDWKEEYRLLSSRLTAQKVLSKLIDAIPEIEPTILSIFFSNLESIEQSVIQSNEKQVLKSPFSSSGRGLLWLLPQKMARSERQIISGMLKKQATVSVEKALDKQLDFSMHFKAVTEEKIEFLGYSIFQTNAKGAYEKSFLAPQLELEKQITTYIRQDLLTSVKNKLIAILEKTYLPYYRGNIGVDMLIYQSENRYFIHPCIEINMRKSMGYLALELQKNFLHPNSTGEFFVDYNPTKIVQQNKKWKEEFPLSIENGFIKSGYLSLCPVTETSNYHVFILVTEEKNLCSIIR